eukprot:81641-Chlamydomonas_euryale.AAC.20
MAMIAAINFVLSHKCSVLLQNSGEYPADPSRAQQPFRPVYFKYDPAVRPCGNELPPSRQDTNYCWKNSPDVLVFRPCNVELRARFNVHASHALQHKPQVVSAPWLSSQTGQLTREASQCVAAPEDVERSTGRWPFELNAAHSPSCPLSSAALQTLPLPFGTELPKSIRAGAEERVDPFAEKYRHVWRRHGGGGIIHTCGAAWNLAKRTAGALRGLDARCWHHVGQLASEPPGGGARLRRCRLGYLCRHRHRCGRRAMYHPEVGAA